MKSPTTGIGTATVHSPRRQPSKTERGRRARKLEPPIVDRGRTNKAPEAHKSFNAALVAQFANNGAVLFKSIFDFPNCVDAAETAKESLMNAAETASESLMNAANDIIGVKQKARVVKNQTRRESPIKGPLFGDHSSTTSARESIDRINRNKRGDICRKREDKRKEKQARRRADAKSNKDRQRKEEAALNLSQSNGGGQYENHKRIVNFHG